MSSAGAAGVAEPSSTDASGNRLGWHDANAVLRLVASGKDDTAGSAFGGGFARKLGSVLTVFELLREGSFSALRVDVDDVVHGS